MKQTGNSHNSRGPRFPCGTEATRILQDSCGNRFAIEQELPCDRWDCPTCGPRIVDEHVKRAQYHFRRVVVYVGTVPFTNKKLSYFLRRKVKKPYMAIRTKMRSVVISGSSFPGSVGIDKRKFLKDILPGILREIDCGRSVSYSRDRKKTSHEKMTSDGNIYGESYECLALIRGNRAQAFNRLKFNNKKQEDFEHARFLQETQSDSKIYSAGQRLIDSLPGLEMAAERMAIQSENGPMPINLTFNVNKIESSRE